MYVKIQPQSKLKTAKKDALTLVNYLDKQNQKVALEEKEYFFTSEFDKIEKQQVANLLGTNYQGLRKEDSKFFMLTLSPSQNEIKHLKNLYKDEKEALKQYSKEVMKGYAIGFNREIEGRLMQEKDLLWFGMYEKQRAFSRKDYEVIYNRELKKNYPHFYVLDAHKKVVQRSYLEALKPGDVKIKERVIKSGENAHVHILVHRKDKSGKLSLSPLSNRKGGPTYLTKYELEGKNISKKEAQVISQKEGQKLGEGSVKIQKEKVQVGFHRVFFKEYCERAFDHKFDYKRAQHESFAYYNQRAKVGLISTDQKKEISLSTNLLKTLKTTGSIYKIGKIPYDLSMSVLNPSHLVSLLISKGISLSSDIIRNRF